jgi:hypothetical protein
MLARCIAFALGLLVSVSSGRTAELCPKYGNCVPAEHFECTEIARSSVVTRVCYNEASSYMIIRLKRTDYHYCAIDAGTVAALVAADSMGRFYNQNIKSNANGGKFDCRNNPVPVF